MEEIRIMTAHTVVAGSGAAGLNAADRLRQYGVEDVILVTERMNAGTSRNTGSDKQTYYKLSLAGGQGDSVRRLARVLYEGGCVDGDHALCEASLSCQGFFKLVELGVPFPHDQLGEFVGYKTDHDPNDRGTSAGPYTSRYMTEALERSVRQRGIPIYDRHQIIRILVHEGKVCGILCLDTGTAEYVLIKCANLVYATGGPAGIYGDSVYPASQMGSSGLAFAAGVKGKNLTEWQYGMASLRPRWNVSGSYMQVLPRFVSTDQDGKDEREFLADSFSTTEAMMDMVFLKGYQWPFDVNKADGGSSVIDLLVYRETCVRNRRVWLDYRDNPGKKPVNFDALSEETRGYLKKAGACQETPYERLLHLNGPAAAFYEEHGVRLEQEMLEIAVCAQHNNGGLSVDSWWQTNVKGFFAVGEAAGTHGIYRPGGSALNAGQVGSTRAAQYIGLSIRTGAKDNMEQNQQPDIDLDKALMQEAGRYAAMGNLRAQNEDYKRKLKEAAKRMSRCGAVFRDREAMKELRRQAEEELAQLMSAKNAAATEKSALPPAVNPADRRAEKLSWFYRYLDTLICQKVYLDAMLDYLDHGGKSRGSAVYTEPKQAGGTDRQIVIPELAAFSLDGPDGRAHQNEVQEIAYDESSNSCQTEWRPVRRLEDIPESGAFEVVWKAYREAFAESAFSCLLTT